MPPWTESAGSRPKSRTSGRWRRTRNYRLSASGFLAEIDRMQLEAREYLSLLPAELAAGV
jgi:hypothetical protein